jgi:hypothetical protein
MYQNNPSHNFHIPVMGIGYTIDTPVKVAQYGISSVISLVDDMLMEKMRAFYCEKIDKPYKEISNKIEDFRAKRITAYLDLLNEMVNHKFQELKQSMITKKEELDKYMKMLPDFSEVKKSFSQFLASNNCVHNLKEWIHNNLSVGSIDVNIMTKLDKENYVNNEKLPIEFNDAHAALRGFANSKLESSIVLSAGMNPRLYGYFESFEDFYPDENGKIRKKIILKVSDYRSATIQGKFFAKKGLWVSEYRIESGLNCGGHAFANDGNLMGPILEEFKNNREILREETFLIYKQALQVKNKYCPTEAPVTKITAQGGVGTAEEHQFLIDYYGLDSVGWGSPFLLVPEVVNVDENTLKLLCNAAEEDYYLSNTSPLGVPFNSLRGNTKDIEKHELIKQNKPGSICQKKYVSFNKEFTTNEICTASRTYQKLKIKELNSQNLDSEKYTIAFNKIVDKSCICVGLGTSALLSNNLDTSFEGSGVSICPGPNLAYFDKVVSLTEMIDHIYGRANIIKSRKRPHMFLKELSLYIDYLRNKVEDVICEYSDKQMNGLLEFKNRLNGSIQYYKKLFKNKFSHNSQELIENIEILQNELNSVEIPVLVN